MSRPRLSIIIPTLNAAPVLEACLTSLMEGLTEGLVREAIVVDGGSTDQSANLARDMGCQVVCLDAPGRGRQLAAGALQAQGDWLLFLHADTRVQPGWTAAVVRHMAERAGKAGYFDLSYDHPHPAAQRIAWWANWRARHFGLPYGDQGLLIARPLYLEIGGYADLPLMEDVDLVRRLGRGCLAGLGVKVVTSAVRYETGGWWRVPLRNLSLLVRFLMGADPARLKADYR